jgi:hypothetical protein
MDQTRCPAAGFVPGVLGPVFSGVYCEQLPIPVVFSGCRLICEELRLHSPVRSDGRQRYGSVIQHDNCHCACWCCASGLCSLVQRVWPSTGISGKYGDWNGGQCRLRGLQLVENVARLACSGRNWNLDKHGRGRECGCGFVFHASARTVRPVYLPPLSPALTRLQVYGNIRRLVTQFHICSLFVYQLILSQRHQWSPRRGCRRRLHREVCRMAMVLLGAHHFGWGNLALQYLLPP